MKKRKAMNSTIILFISGVLIALLSFMATSNIINMNLSSDYRKIAEAKTIEMRNSLLYLNTVEEGMRIINMPEGFKAILEEQNIVVECNVPVFCTGGVNHNLTIKPINKDIVIPATIEAEQICISKKIFNCKNQMTICLPSDPCCDFEPLTNTLCTSSNPYD